MTKTEHNPEPWSAVALHEADGEWDVRDASGDSTTASSVVNLDGIFTEANARRIVACVNACRGMPLEVLERVPHGHRHALLTTLLGHVPATELIVGATEWCRSYLRARGYSIED